MAKATSEKYLLILSYPSTDYPIGLFDSAEAALKFAADHPPPKTQEALGGYPETDDAELYDRYRRGCPMTWNDDNEGKERPKGYTIIKFTGDKPTGWAHVEPYIEAPKDDSIDPDQELDWL